MSDIKCNTVDALFNTLLTSYTSFRENEADRFSNNFGYSSGSVFEREMSSINKDRDNYSDEWNRLINEHDAINRAISRMNAIDEFKQTLIEIGFSRLDGRVSSKEIEFYAKKLKEQE